MISRFVYNEKKMCYERKPIAGLQPVQILSPSVVDYSDWRPNIDTVSVNDMRGSRTPYYDYPDGKDTGLDLTYLRSPSRDITEIQEMQSKLQKTSDANLSALSKEVEAAIAEEQTSEKSSEPS